MTPTPPAGSAPSDGRQTSAPEAHRHVATPIATGLMGRCPRCGEGRLFSGVLTVAPSCEVCGLDYGFADSADGPAVFVMFIAGFLVVAVAIWLEVAYTPPWWVHAMVQLPLVIGVSIAMLRPLKGLLIVLQYVNRAEEARLRADP
jgi:uncharacterized protein (DUF983 family)